MGNKQSSDAEQRLKNEAAPCHLYDVGYEGNVYCNGKCNQKGTVWGSSDAYTSDSCVCRAARHAGVIPESGEGIFKVIQIAGRPSYVGEPSNGIESKDFGASAGSIIFEKVAPPK